MATLIPCPPSGLRVGRCSVVPSLLLRVSCIWAPWCRFASAKSSTRVEELHWCGKTSLSRKVINLCFVLAGQSSWESAGLARPQTPLRAKVLATVEVPAQGVFSPLWCVKCLLVLKPGRSAAWSGACAVVFVRELAAEGCPPEFGLIAHLSWDRRQNHTESGQNLHERKT